MQCCLVICGASLPSALPVPAELNSVSDSSRRHSPTKRIGSINTGWGGVRWVCRVERGSRTEEEKDGSR